MAARGKIQEYEKITSNYDYLTVELINGIDLIIVSLFSKQVIDFTQKTTLLKKGADGDNTPKVREFLDILMFSGEGAFAAFLATLRDHGFTQAVNRLEQGDQQQPKPSTSNSNRHPSTDFPHRDHQIPESHLEKKRDQMKKEDLHVIRREYSCLLKTIDVQHVQPLLVQEVILDRKDIDRLRKALKEGSREKATEELLDIVMYESGSDIFPIFVKCLNDSGYKELANKLQPSVYF